MEFRQTTMEDSTKMNESLIENCCCQMDLKSSKLRIVPNFPEDFEKVAEGQPVSMSYL